MLNTTVLDCPDSTYFRTSDITPFIQDGILNIYNGRGTRRSSWGQPNVSSVVSELSADVVCVTVTGWHKHTVSPVGGKFYFVRESSGWVRRRANNKVVAAALQGQLVAA